MRKWREVMNTELFIATLTKLLEEQLRENEEGKKDE